jgi:polyphenol oxidase
VQVNAAFSLRESGVSIDQYQGLNLGDHVDDDPVLVNENRKLISQSLQLPSPPCWLQQTHSTLVKDLAGYHIVEEADAAYSNQKGKVAVIMTADCLPVYFCDDQGKEVALAHAGWRGLLEGVIEKTLDSFEAKPENIMAYLGPAISQANFEVGAEVRQVFVDRNSKSESAFIATSNGKYLADLYRLATQRLQQAGIAQIYGQPNCTFAQADKFYSYRREGQTGRMAHFIWLE